MRVGKITPTSSWLMRGGNLRKGILQKAMDLLIQIERFLISFRVT